MNGFSISDAAFTGFRIARERPRAVATWTAIQFVVSMVLGGAAIALAGPDLARLRDAGASVAAQDTGQLLAIMRRLAPIYGLILVYALVFSPLLYAAMNRAVIRPAEDRFGYFRLGADEARQFLLMLLVFAVALGGYIVAVLVTVVVAVVVGLAAKAAVGLAVVVCLLAGAGVALFFLVRLSLASAQTFATGRVTLLGSWVLTRGRFWPILGTYVLTGAFAAVVYLLWFVLTFAIVAAIGGMGAVAAMRPNLGSLASLFTPAALAQTVLSAIVTALLWPVLGAPPAVIYLRLTGGAATGAPD